MLGVLCNGMSLYKFEEQHVRNVKGEVKFELYNLEVLSSGRFKSVYHRAVTNKLGPRVSRAMFYGPNFDSIIGPIEKLIRRLLSALPSFFHAFSKFLKFLKFEISFWIFVPKVNSRSGIGLLNNPFRNYFSIKKSTPK